MSPVNLQAANDLLSKVLGGSSSLQVTGTVLLAGGNGLQNGILDSGGVLLETHVSQHHDGGEQKGSGVSKTLAGNIGGGTVDSLKDRDLVTHVTRGGKTKTTNEAGGKVRENVTVQVGHDHDVLLVRSRVGDQSKAGGVNELRLKSDLGVLLGKVLGGAKEKTIRDLHDRSLVDGKNLGLANGAGVLESVSENTLRSLLGDKLDGLDDTRDNNVLDTGVLTLGVLTNEDGVDTVVGGLVTNNRLARTDVGEEVEGSSKGQVEGNMSLTDRGSKRTLKGDKVLADRVDSSLRNGSLAIDKDGGDINRLPLNRNLGSLVNVLDSLGNLDTNTVSLDQSHGVVALGRC